MGIVATLYWPATGRIEKCVGMSGTDQLAAYIDAGMAWIGGRSSRTTQMVQDGAIVDRPSLASSIADAPYVLDLAEVIGDTTITDEDGEVLIAPGGEEVELPAGVYSIEPPFPWRAQTVTVE